MKIEEVAESTYRLEVLMPTVRATFAVYFIGEAGGAVIEPGPAATIPSIREAMKQLGMRELAYIIPTHIHMDHAGGIGSLAQLFPQAKVVLHPLSVRHVIEPARLIEGTRMAFGDDFEACFGPILPVSGTQIKAPDDGEVLFLDGRELQIVYAPGHAPHHIAIFDRKTKGLFCGEALGLPVSEADSFVVPVAAPPSFDVEVYLQTMEKLRRLGPQILFYSHDGVGRRPEELIVRAGENTKVFADMILSALRRGETAEAISRRVQEFVSEHQGVCGEEVAMQMTIDGFIFYFRKNKLV